MLIEIYVWAMVVTTAACVRPGEAGDLAEWAGAIWPAPSGRSRSPSASIAPCGGWCVVGDPVVVESWHLPRALSDEALRLLTSLPMEEIERRLRMDGPAVSEGREPAAVKGKPSDSWLPVHALPLPEVE